MKLQIHSREGGREGGQTGWAKKARKKGGPSGSLQQGMTDQSKIRKMTKRYSYKFDIQFLWKSLALMNTAKL